MAPKMALKTIRRLLLALLTGLLFHQQGTTAEPRVRKVLPSFLDAEGRASLHPSLFERDAYQAHLRKNPELIRGMRFDVHWSAPASRNVPVELRLELRGATVGTNGAPTTPGSQALTNAVVLTAPVQPPVWGARWTRLTLDAESLRQVGDVTAWRAVLIRSGVPVATNQSFLW